MFLRLRMAATRSIHLRKVNEEPPPESNDYVEHPPAQGYEEPPPESNDYAEHPPAQGYEEPPPESGEVR